MDARSLNRATSRPEATPPVAEKGGLDVAGSCCRAPGPGRAFNSNLRLLALALHNLNGAGQHLPSSCLPFRCQRGPSVCFSLLGGGARSRRATSLSEATPAGAGKGGLAGRLDWDSEIQFEQYCDPDSAVPCPEAR